MSDDETMKSLLRRSLHRGRENLRWKLSGLDERSLRWPRTPTGFNLLGALKHMAQVEIVYFGDTFDRAWPNPEEVVTDADIDLDPQADWCAAESETIEYLLDLYTRAADFADETIDALRLDSPGRVPHWPGGSRRSCSQSPAYDPNRLRNEYHNRRSCRISCLKTDGDRCAAVVGRIPARGDPRPGSRTAEDEG